MTQSAQSRFIFAANSVGSPIQAGATSPCLSGAGVFPASPPGLYEFAPDTPRQRWRNSKSRTEVTAMLLELLGKLGASQASSPAPSSSGQTTASVVGPRSSGFVTSCSEDSPVSWMVRNIPAECTCEDLLREWPVDGSYNLLYLPRRAGGKATLGYAFISFTSGAHAEAFVSHWRSKRLASFPKGRGLNITVAARQGFEENLRQLQEKSSRDMRARCCEVIVVKDGRRITLEEA
eukprot:CAMPEP_0176104922 /NCGR_PEP_ID=MMETSP0120_2-20121206/52650_1 /TAXON_ID=160619 /ORGANISM="Kryptoperidinium foliaceum, Strain CCMP 1326" /LENGTH=233 /DNA_ID=CAMNT_0017439033 /DNA_START=9 /DNA_END=710 /DNA_ORIENTATION=-